MKRLIAIAAIVAAIPTAKADSFVRGYTRSDGTYVAPHTRSTPDAYRYNNRSSQSFGGSQRDEFSRQPATNRGNWGYGSYDNDGDGLSNGFDPSPNDSNN